MIKFYVLFFTAVFMSCGGGRSFKKNPVDVMIRDLDKVKPFTIVLYDMDVDGSFSKTYKHQYKIITENNGEPKEEFSQWYKVSEDFFFANENNLGMEVASKDSTGKVNKSVSPAGYSNYVGNPKYGHWVQGSGGSFWEFYGKYAMMSTMFNMFSAPRYGHYNDYYSNYRYQRSYYGPSYKDRYGNSRNYYGTYGRNTEKARPNFYKRKVDKIKQSRSSFKDRVRSKVSRSSSRYKSSSSSFRSRGGGFGK